MLLGFTGVSGRRRGKKQKRDARSLLQEVIPNIIIPVEPLEPFLPRLEPQLSALGGRDKNRTDDVSESGGGELGLTRVVEGGEEGGFGAEERHEGVEGRDLSKRSRESRRG